MLRRCTDQALLLKDVSLSVVARQLGCWLESLSDLLSLVEKNWFLETYCCIANLSWNKNTMISKMTTSSLTTNTVIIDSKNIIDKSSSNPTTASTHSMLFISCKR